MSFSPLLRTGLIAAVVLAAAGCGSGSTTAPTSLPPQAGATTSAPTASPTTASTTASPTTTSPTTTAAPTTVAPSTSAKPKDDDAAPTKPGGTGKQSQAPGAGAQLTVTEVRVGVHDKYDRVVFELSGQGTPGWEVSPATGATQDGSGMPVKVAGDGLIQVVITGVKGIPDQGEVKRGPVQGDGVLGVGKAVKQVVYAGSFEGRSQAYIGLDKKNRKFSVSGLANPPRVVVDIER